MRNTVHRVDDDGLIREFQVVYPPKPVFSDEDFKLVGILVEAHFIDCDDQTVSCHACSVYIEHFSSDEQRVSYVPVSDDYSIDDVFGGYPDFI